jgi:hypothetical protein
MDGSNLKHMVQPLSTNGWFNPKIKMDGSNLKYKWILYFRFEPSICILGLNHPFVF